MSCQKVWSLLGVGALSLVGTCQAEALNFNTVGSYTNWINFGVTATGIKNFKLVDTDPLFRNTILSQNTLPPETSGQVKNKQEKSMGGGSAEAEATFFRNGLIVIETRAVSRSWSQGTKASFFVVGSDKKGRALFASPLFDIPTACSKADSCSSNRRGTTQHRVNSQLAKYIAKINVYVQDRGSPGLRESINKTIKETCGTFDDLPKAAKAGIAAETGFAGCK
jgi:hypothetical protein